MVVNPSPAVRKRLLVYGITWREPRNAIFLHALSRHYDVMAVTAGPLEGRLLELAQPVRFRYERFIIPGKVGFGVSAGLAGAAREFRPDLILTLETHSLAALQAVMLARKMGIRSAVFTWQNVAAIPRLAFQKLPQRYVLRHADHLLAGSIDAERYLIDRGADAGRIAVVPETGYDSRIFTPEGGRYREDWGYGSGEFVVLYAGRLVPEKGVASILAAARSLRDTCPKLRFVFVGSGPLAGMIRSCGLPIVSCRGSFPFVDMGRVMRSCDLFLYPSRSTKYWVEQFGYAPIEAVACGSPAIVSDSGMLKSLIRPGREGSIVPEGSNDALRQEIAMWYETWQGGGLRVDRSDICRYAAEQVADSYRLILG